MFHGDKDEMVPIEHAVAARDLLVSSGKKFENIIYPGAGHAFDIPGGATYDAAATADARQKVVVFLQAGLK
jgi:dienelactone hydrolase